ncbi:MAG: CADD family putative folate metabolism protein [Dehalococcoidia bacterium]
MTNDLLQRLDSAIAERGMLKHPFYVAWSQGRLTREMLKDYACQYYHLESSFPRMVSAVHSNTPDLGVRQHLLENLVDEEQGDENHPALWLRFARALGATDDDVLNVDVLPSTRAAIDTMTGICRDKPYQEGMAALYAYESQIPEVARVKIDGLNRFYGMDDPEEYKFFSVHEEADAWHSEVERKLIDEHTDSESADAVVSAAATSAGALWGFLDGIHETYVTQRAA